MSSCVHDLLVCMMRSIDLLPCLSESCASRLAILENQAWRLEFLGQVSAPVPAPCKIECCLPVLAVSAPNVGFRSDGSTACIEGTGAGTSAGPSLTSMLVGGIGWLSSKEEVKKVLVSLQKTLLARSVSYRRLLRSVSVPGKVKGSKGRLPLHSTSAVASDAGAKEPGGFIMELSLSCSSMNIWPE